MQTSIQVNIDYAQNILATNEVLRLIFSDPWYGKRWLGIKGVLDFWLQDMEYNLYCLSNKYKDVQWCMAASRSNFRSRVKFIKMNQTTPYIAKALILFHKFFSRLELSMDRVMSFYIP